MAEFFKTLLEKFQLAGSEDDYEDDDDFLDELEDEPAPSYKSSRTNRREQAATEEPSTIPLRRNTREVVQEDEKPLTREKTFRTERSNKVVPIRTTSKGKEVCILKPAGFDDSQDVCDILLSNRAAVVNLEGFDPEEAQRIMDFISGCVYAINGKLHQISKYIFIFSPDSWGISGDFLDLAQDNSAFGVPTLNREF